MADCQGLEDPNWRWTWGALEALEGLAWVAMGYGKTVTLTRWQGTTRTCVNACCQMSALLAAVALRLLHDLL